MVTFLKELFSDNNTASFSRLGSFVALLFACIWVSRIVWRTGGLPNLEGLTILISSLYGLGKAGETIQRVLGAKNER